MPFRPLSLDNCSFVLFLAELPVRRVRAVRWIAKVVTVVVVCAAAAAGCEQTPTSPSNNAPFSQVDLRVGSGAEAQTGQALTVHYTGWFYNAANPNQKGPQFDSSLGGAGFAFNLGFGEVINGWDVGVAGMRVGGIRRLVIPPSMAYGTGRNSSIPPNATLLFEIELLGIAGTETGS